MLKAAIIALALSLSSPAWCRTQDVPFVTGANTAAVRMGVQALRQAIPTMNVPVSAISAALIDLNADGSPELFVYLGGDFCGSGGCQMMLFERGTIGWVELGLWQGGYISVTDVRDAGWLHLVLDHTHTWRHGLKRYELLR